MKRAMPWHRVRRLLAVRLDNLGDVVMLSPALRSIRAAAPQAAITLLASPAGAEAASLLPEVDEVMAHRASWQALGGAAPPASDEMALIDRLRDGHFDAAVIFTSFSQDPGPPALVCHLAGIPLRAGWAPLFAGAVLTHPVVPPDPTGHQAERNVELVQALGAPELPTEIVLRIPEDAARAGEAIVASAGLRPGGYVALLPGASAPARRYPAERYADAARQIWDTTSLPSIVLGGERDRPIADVIVRQAGVAARSLVGATDVPTAAALVKRAALVMAGNSLALHLADALAVPVVAAYSGTDLESQWAPRSTPTRLFRVPTSCSPCYAIECPYEMECLAIPGRTMGLAGLDLISTSAAAPTVPA